MEEYNKLNDVYDFIDNEKKCINDDEGPLFEVLMTVKMVNTIPNVTSFADVYLKKEEDYFHQIEVAQRTEDPLCEVLSYMGVQGEFVAESKFHSGQGLMTRIGEYDNLWYKGEQIKEIDLPMIGAERMTSRMLGNTQIVTSKGYCGDASSERYMIGVRAKLDGVQMMVFNISTIIKTYSFFWTDKDIILLSQNVQSSLFEKVGDICYVLNGAVSNMEALSSILGVVMKHHTYEHVTREACEVLSVKGDGLIFNLDGTDVKVPNTRVVSLYYDGKCFTDCFFKRRYVMQSEEKFVKNVIYDVDLEQKLVLRKRLDKEKADSALAIDVIMNSMIIVQQFLDTYALPYHRRVMRWKDFKIQYLGEGDAVGDLLSKGIKRREGLLVYKNRKNRVIDHCSYYSLYDNSTYGYWLCGSNFKKYTPVQIRMETILGYQFVTSWFPGSTPFLVKEEGAKKFILLKDVPGEGLIHVAYAMKEDKIDLLINK